MRRFTAFGVLFIVLSWSFLTLQGWTGPPPPGAVQGVLDLSRWDFNTKGPAVLAGDWDFFWQTQLPPGMESSGSAPDSPIKVPGVWNGISVKGNPIPGQGFASFRLRVNLPDTTDALGIKFLDAATAFTAFANGQEIYRSGTPGKDEASTRPGYHPGVAVLPDPGGQVTLVIHVSNFAHWQGGLWENLSMGRLSDLTLAREHKIFFDALLFGSILIMGIYHLFLYRFRPQDRSTLYFGLFCLLTALRPLFHGERVILGLFPSIGFSLFLQITYISFYLCVPLFSLYTLALFPRQVSATVVRCIAGAGILAALTPLLFPSSVFTAMMPWLQAATVAAVGYGCYCLVRAVRAKEPDAQIFIVGFIIFFITIVNDILYTRQFISTAHLVPLGLFTFILCQAVLLARRFSLAFAMVTSQQQELLEEMIQRKQVEQNLVESEIRFRMMADFMPIPLCETDGHLNIIYANKTAIGWFGYPEEEMTTGMPLTTILADPNISSFAQLSRHLKNTGEFLILKKDGERVWAQIEMTPILSKARLMGHRICFVDLTERKKAEAASLHAAEQSKYILVGQVAGKMAHDFNNILSAVMGNSELSLMDCTDPDIRESLSIILEQARRGQMLTQNLVAFAKDQDPNEECINLNEKLDLVLQRMQGDLEDIVVKKEYCRSIPEVRADPGMIEQSLVNIVQNALHAMSRSQNPELAVRTFVRSDHAGIEISDNGCGIPEQYQKEIYMPSFTLKGGQDKRNAYAHHIKGTGYGMANVKKYMDKHKGKISFTSVQGRGTCFTLLLPVEQKTCHATEVLARPAVKGVQGKKILVVEDEAAISKVFFNILTHPPFDNHVTIAENGQAAMDLADTEVFDLVSLDHMLPGTATGMDVYRHIRRSNPDIPVIFVSGNMEFIDSIQGLIRKDQHLAHLPKPCDNHTYARAVERWFASRV